MTLYPYIYAQVAPELKETGGIILTYFPCNLGVLGKMA